MRSIRTPRVRAAILAALREQPNITRAAEAAGIGRSAAYAWYRDDPEMARDWEAAIAESVERLEQEAWRRAVEGWDRRPIIDRRTGETLGYEREYSDRLMDTLLRAHLPKKYSNNSTVELTGPGGGPIRVSAAELTDDELAEIAAGDKEA